MTNIPDKFDELESENFSLNYIDASPSELIHNSDEKFISIIFVHFFHISRNKLKQISQFKKTRGIKRKLQTQKYIIDSLDNNLINLCGISNWNLSEVALKNGAHILNLSMNVEKDKSLNDDIVINGISVNYGLCVSLGWYSIVLASFMSQIGQIARVTNKKNAAILLDLLSGDSIFNFRNIKIVENIIDNSILSKFQTDAIQTNKLETLGFGYGQKNGNTKDLKNDFEYVIVDWIVQSFHSLLQFEKDNLNKDSEEYKLSELARYLIHKRKFRISDAFELIH